MKFTSVRLVCSVGLAALAAAIALVGPASAARHHAVLRHPDVICCGGGGTKTNYSDVVSYALQYAGTDLGTDSSLGYNPAYLFWDDDCTNFISQALTAGGWTNDSSGTYQWWYHSTPPHLQFSTETSSWINVQSFVTYAYNSGRGIFINSGASKENANWDEVVPGDILMVDWTGDGTIDHAEIVTSTSGVSWGNVKLSDIKITQHTTDRKDYALTNDTTLYPNAKWWIMEPY